jgi:hypothetical protein
MSARAERRTIVAAVVLGALLWPATGTAAPSVTELTGGVTPGFTAAGGPIGITSGPDGNSGQAKRARFQIRR